MQNKTCKKCQIEQPITAFSKHASFPDGLNSRCKNCKNIEGNLFYKKNKAYILARQRTYKRVGRKLWKYHMNEEDLEKRLINQNKRCAICDKPFGKFCVDHDHATTKVRGLLCPNCNVGLGMFKDNALFLKQAISDLEMAKEVGAAPTVACATGV